MKVKKFTFQKHRAPKGTREETQRDNQRTINIRQEHWIGLKCGNSEGGQSDEGEEHTQGAGNLIVQLQRERKVG
jgi:hypothetical protein